MASFTITEKGYTLTGPDGMYLDIVKKDMEQAREAIPQHECDRFSSVPSIS